MVQRTLLDESIDADIEASSEKLDYTPGVFWLERHIRGKRVCRSSEEFIQALVPPDVIDNGVPTVGLLAHVLIYLGISKRMSSSELATLACWRYRICGPLSQFLILTA